MTMQWVISNLANGAAIVLSAHISAVEHVGFECSDAGLSVLAKLARTRDDIDSEDSIELVIGKTVVSLNVQYMLETHPNFWAATVTNPEDALALMSKSTSFTVVVPGRSIDLNFDAVKMREFVSECYKRTGKK